MLKTIKKTLRKIIIFVFNLSLFLLVSCKTEVYEHKRENLPNIVLFVADDAGWHDVGYHGSEIQTPNIDKLAETGVELNQFYVYPTCSPSRASLLTGKYASRFGIGGPIALRSEQVLPEDVATLPGVLKEAGYTTAITGKWHLGLRLENGPGKYGFDYTYGYLHGQVDQYTHRYKNGDKTWNRNGEFIEEEGHATDLITNEAINYVTEIRDKSKPFFMYVAYSVPHYPLQEEDKWIEPYKDLDDVESRKLFAASMTHMDYSIGEIMQTLGDEKLLDNTLVIFISDNGGQKSWDSDSDHNTKYYEGKHGPYPKLGDNSPFKGYKGGLYEGGVRVPAILNWKSILKPQKVDGVIKVTDVFPTITSLIDNSITKGLNIDGENIWNVISGKQKGTEDRELYLRTKNELVLRKGDWKLMHFGTTLDEGREELYNLKKDPNETKNVIEEHPSIREDLFKELQNQIKFDPNSN